MELSEHWASLVIDYAMNGLSSHCKLVHQQVLNQLSHSESQTVNCAGRKPKKTLYWHLNVTHWEKQQSVSFQVRKQVSIVFELMGFYTLMTYCTTYQEMHCRVPSSPVLSAIRLSQQQKHFFVLSHSFCAILNILFKIFSKMQNGK